MKVRSTFSALALFLALISLSAIPSSLSAPLKQLQKRVRYIDADTGEVYDRMPSDARVISSTSSSQNRQSSGSTSGRRYTYSVQRGSDGRTSLVRQRPSSNTNSIHRSSTTSTSSFQQPQQGIRHAATLPNSYGNGGGQHYDDYDRPTYGQAVPAPIHPAPNYRIVTPSPIYRTVSPHPHIPPASGFRQVPATYSPPPIDYRYVSAPRIPSPIGGGYGGSPSAHSPTNHGWEIPPASAAGGASNEQRVVSSHFATCCICQDEKTEKTNLCKNHGHGICDDCLNGMVQAGTRQVCPHCREPLEESNRRVETATGDWDAEHNDAMVAAQVG